MFWPVLLASSDSDENSTGIYLENSAVIQLKAIYPTHLRFLIYLSLVSGGLLQTSQTWATAGVCGASCVHVLGFGLFVCLFYKQLR